MKGILGARRRRGKRRGAIMLDVMMGLFVLVAAVTSYGALIPMVKRGQAISQDEELATQMMQRMLEHVQMLRPNNINQTTLEDLHLIERNQSAQPFKMTRMPMDEDSHYSPAKRLRNADAEMTFRTLSEGSKLIIITISFDSESGKRRSIQSGTIVGAF